MSAGFGCACGALHGTARPAGAAGGAHVVCYCSYCRAHAERLGAPRALDAAGGLALWQTVPDRISLARGEEHLACMRLSRRGPLRWYAACCRTPLAITAPLRGVPFASLVVAAFDEPDAAGPIVARVNVGGARGRLPGRPPRGGLARVAALALGRTAAARLLGRHLATPFFDAAGRPVAEPGPPPPAPEKAAPPSA